MEETHLTARTMSFIAGPEVAARARLKVLREKQRIAERAFGPPLSPAEEHELRYLTVFYPKPLRPTPKDEIMAVRFPELCNVPLT